MNGFAVRTCSIAENSAVSPKSTKEKPKVKAEGALDSLQEETPQVLGGSYNFCPHYCTIKSHHIQDPSHIPWESGSDCTVDVSTLLDGMADNLKFASSCVNSPAELTSPRLQKRSSFFLPASQWPTGFICLWGSSCLSPKTTQTCSTASTSCFVPCSQRATHTPPRCPVPQQACLVCGGLQGVGIQIF